MSAPKGRLLLVPNTLDHGNEPAAITDVIAHGALTAAAALAHWVVEDARSARGFLKRVSAQVPLASTLQQVHMTELPRARKGSKEPVAAQAWRDLLAPALAGHDVGLLSEAGLPAVADPGAHVVAAAHELDLAVWPLAGASALLLALAASGLNGQSFAFVGYLPQEGEARQRRIQALEAASRQHGQTQLFIETPYRNPALAAALLSTLRPDTRLSISIGLTLAGGWNRCHTIEQWRRTPPALPGDMPAVFALLAPSGR